MRTICGTSTKPSTVSFWMTSPIPPRWSDAVCWISWPGRSAAYEGAFTEHTRHRDELGQGRGNAHRYRNPRNRGRAGVFGFGQRLRNERGNDPPGDRPVLHHANDAQGRAGHPLPANGRRADRRKYFDHLARTIEIPQRLRNKNQRKIFQKAHRLYPARGYYIDGVYAHPGLARDRLYVYTHGPGAFRSACRQPKCASCLARMSRCPRQRSLRGQPIICASNTTPCLHKFANRKRNTYRKGHQE